MNRRRTLLLAGLLTLALVTGCGAVPAQYIRQAEPDVTMTALTESPRAYQGKTVILGGVVVEEIPDGTRLWLRLKNRPLDKDYRPHRPTINEGPEAGYYWVVAPDVSLLPPNWKQWARVTVVGRMMDQKEPRPTAGPPSEPVLTLVFMRGWTMGTAKGKGAWEESVDANYLLSVPEGLHGE
ncbi:MAG: Slp family lipoprotein [Nitrospira sp.]|nr:Slp family lipoprotein [Nitrospira sp.]